jgi:hypothetical protein
MIQNVLLVLMVILCTLLIISILKNPFDSYKNACKFKIQRPKYKSDNNKKSASFNILVEKKHRYFINFPLLFKFYSKEKFKTFVRIKYITEEEDQILFEKDIEFTSIVCEHVVYITDIIMGKITVEIFLNIEHGNPIIGFEIMNNNTCDLTKEYKLELIFS